MSYPNAFNQSLEKFQNIFPTIDFPKFDHKIHSLEHTFQSIMNLLVVPSECNMSSALTTMRQIIDQQQYKYQKSLLIQDEHDHEMLLFDEEYDYQQCSTGILNKKITTSTMNDCQINMVDDLWGWKYQEKNQNQELKEQYQSFLN